MTGNCGTDLWVATYTSAAEPTLPKPVAKKWATWRIWQYSCSGHVPGIDGNVDLNRYNGSMNDFRLWLGLDVVPTWEQEIDAWARTMGYTGVGPSE